MPPKSLVSKHCERSRVVFPNSSFSFKLYLKNRRLSEAECDIFGDFQHIMCKLQRWRQYSVCLMWQKLFAPSCLKKLFSWIVHNNVSGFEHYANTSTICLLLLPNYSYSWIEIKCKSKEEFQAYAASTYFLERLCVSTLLFYSLLICNTCVIFLRGHHHPSAHTSVNEAAGVHSVRKVSFLRPFSTSVEITLLVFPS